MKLVYFVRVNFLILSAFGTVSHTWDMIGTLVRTTSAFKRRFGRQFEPCSDSEFQCRSTGVCIPKDRVCDETQDCDDDSDEPDSCYEGLILCPPSEERCPRQRQCIGRSSFCDGWTDCRDAVEEDAQLCHQRTCLKNEVRCNSGQCIEVARFCRGLMRCHDRSLSHTTHAARVDAIL